LEHHIARIDFAQSAMEFGLPYDDAGACFAAGDNCQQCASSYVFGVNIMKIG
jgi:hypothetical protein